MMKRTTLLVVSAAALAVLAAACGGSKKSSTTTTTQTKSPVIVLFRGPTVVPCGKKGEMKTVSYKYATKNATAVEPEVDHQAIGAQAGYDPKSGTMRFPYKCPGPHTVTISAFAQGGKQASKSAQVVPESSG
jgi:hypothetical protein